MKLGAGARRRRGAGGAVGSLSRRLSQLTEELGGMRERVSELTAQSARLEQALAGLREHSPEAVEAFEQTHAVLRAWEAEEPGNHDLLEALRGRSDYELAWTEPSPLVSVVIATGAGGEALCARMLPSILAQTHGELEVLVLGTHADPAVAEAIGALDDARVRYPCAPLGEDDGSPAAELRGRWIVHFDDEAAAMRPDCLATLLALAREQRAEAVHGLARVHLRDGGHEDIGESPPTFGRFTWTSGMLHAGLRLFEREQQGAELELPRDWWLAERMRRTGVRFAAAAAPLCDLCPAWPS